MMIINLDITFCRHRQIKKTMYRKKGQHMIHETDTGFNLRCPVPSILRLQA